MVRLEIPEDLLKDFNMKSLSHLMEIIEIGVKQMKIEKALCSFEKGEISIAKAAELASVSLCEMMLQASARGFHN